MVRVNPKSLNNLSYKPSELWSKGKTMTFRVPIAIKDKVKDYALYIDKDGIEYHKLLTMYDELKIINEKIGKVTGYKNNGSSQLIKDIKRILDDIN